MSRKSKKDCKDVFSYLDRLESWLLDDPKIYMRVVTTGMVLGYLLLIFALLSIIYMLPNLYSYLFPSHDRRGRQSGTLRDVRKLNNQIVVKSELQGNR